MNFLKPSQLYEAYPIPSLFLLFLGSVSLLSLSSRFLRFLYRKFLRAGKNLMKTYGGKDAWALVTGASDGIGKEFCESLARRGFNVCLIARNPEKLASVSQSLSAKYPAIKTAVLIADFSESPKDPIAFYSRILDQFPEKGISEVAVLVNNAGYSEMDRFQNIGLKDLNDMLAVNVYPACFLTRLLAPKMLERSKKSLVINVSSVTAVAKLPFLAPYGASKAFLDHFSQMLGTEFEGKIDFLSLRPNYVSSKMSKLKPGGVVITPRVCAEACLMDAGWDQATSGHWKHELLEWAMVRLLPQKTLSGSSQTVMKRIEASRKKSK